MTPTWTAESRRFVADARVGRLATLREDSTLHLVPVCFAFDGEAVYSVIDQKPKRVGPAALQRVRNILRHPQATLLVDHYAEDWSQLGFVMVTGTAAVLWEGSERDRAVGLLGEKYAQYRQMDLEGRPVIRLAPQRVTAWGRVSAE